jgi:hypothetical protein
MDPGADREIDEMASTTSVAKATSIERQAVHRSKVRVQDGVVISEDDARAAELGRLHELPSMAEALAAWTDRISRDVCEDYATDFRNVLLAANGKLAELTPVGFGDFAPGRIFSQPPAIGLPLTYKTFGSILRRYCSPPKNVAQCLVQLPTNETGPGHSGATMRLSSPHDSPRAVAFNAYLDKRKRHDQTITTLTGEPATTAIFRTRLLPRFDEKGVELPSERTAIAVVSPDHCLKDGDDDKLIAALLFAFGDRVQAARGVAFRGVEESELRAVFPTLEIQVPGAGTEKWHGYIVARNSESGAKSWTISAGLYRAVDGASVACEAVIRTGRHVGRKVAERMVDVANGASELLQRLADKAAELASLPSPWSNETLLRAHARGAGGHPCVRARRLLRDRLRAWAHRRRRQGDRRGPDRRDRRLRIGHAAPSRRPTDRGDAGPAAGERLVGLQGGGRGR